MYWFNHLKSTEHDDPASWFIRKGFIVRSIKTNAYWYQVAFKDTNSETQLEERERKDYESICPNLNPNWVKKLQIVVNRGTGQNCTLGMV